MHIYKHHNFNLFQIVLLCLVILLNIPNHLFSKSSPCQLISDQTHKSWLRCKNNSSNFFMAGPGDPEGFLYRGVRNQDGTRDGDQMELIQKLKNTGANCIYLMAVRSHGGDGDMSHNPFIDSDPEKGLDQDILNQWETWFTEMDKAGIVIFFIFYDDSARIWNTFSQVSHAEKNFIQGIVAKFQHYKHLIWCIAEEYQERYNAIRVKNIAMTIRSLDNYDHPISVHKLHGLDFDEFADDPNIDQFAIQYNVSSPMALHRGVVSAWKNASGRYNLNFAEAINMGTGQNFRKKIWSLAMGGAYVMVLGMDIVNTPIFDLKALGQLRNFFEKTDFINMYPRDELGFYGTEYVMASDEDRFILYSSRLKEEKFGLQCAKTGKYRFIWLDINRDFDIIQENIFLKRGKNVINSPGNVGNEAALYIQPN